MTPELASWVTWALQGLIAFLLWQLWRKTEENGRGIHRIEVDLPTNYLPKSEFNGYREYHTKKVHDVSDRVHKLELKEAVRQGQELGPG